MDFIPLFGIFAESNGPTPHRLRRQPTKQGDKRYMNRMKHFTSWALAVLLTAAIAACSDDEEAAAADYQFAFDTPALYFAEASGQQTASFAAEGISDLSVSAKPTGWDVQLDISGRKVTVAIPELQVATSGLVTLTGKTADNLTKSISLFVGIVPTEEMSGRAANCYLVSRKETRYTFEAVRGDGMTVTPSSVDVVWQSLPNLVQYLDLQGSTISFYVGCDGVDADLVKQGNALIGAYDAEGELLWSWHIWATPYDPDAEAIDLRSGYRLMNRNLGALKNDNSAPSERLASYGLYYQWGRKDPFIGPSTYRFDNGYSASLYDAKSNSIALRKIQATDEIGTEGFALSHPHYFITGCEENRYDWSWSPLSSWKAANDPCPYGWEVAPAAAFVGLTLKGMPTAENEEDFGWVLTDGTEESLFMAGGRRSYLNGSFTNIYLPESEAASAPVRNTALEGQPWIGLYWTATPVSDRNASALYFWFEKKSATGGIRTAVPYARANGMPVRCVRKAQAAK